MPAYSYKNRFVPFVKDGSKEQTVRGRRKNPPRVGQMAFNYFGLRTKHCEKLNEKPISGVNCIVFYKVFDEIQVVIFEKTLDVIELEVAKVDPFRSGLGRRKWLTPKEKDVFAWKDGFRAPGSTIDNPVGSFLKMVRFWGDTHELPWSGDIIYFNTQK